MNNKKHKVRFYINRFKDDINPNISISCKKLDSILKKCFYKANKLIQDDFKCKDNKNYRENLIYILLGMEDTHKVIREIFAKYKQNDEYKTIYALPLVRTQIESVFTIAFIRRNFEEAIKLFVISSWKQFYQKSFYEIEEKNQLNRFQEQNKILNELKNFIVNIGKKNIYDPKIEGELSNLEKNINQGVLSKFKKFPSPTQIIDKIIFIDESDPIIEVLKRLYVDYCWLSSFIHGNSMIGYTMALINNNIHNLNLLLQREYLIRNQIENNIMLDYLAILIVLTDICFLVNNSTHLKTCLSEFWSEYHDFSPLTKFIWGKWAQGVLGVLEIKK